MGLLFGHFGGNSTPTSDLKLKELESLLKWENADYFESYEANLSVKTLVHKNFRKDRADIIFFDKANDLGIFVSGHFYNQEELINKLGIQSPTIRKPELVGKLIHIHGPDFANLINGDFTILIYYKSKNALVIYRDHVGIRPISYTLNEDGFWFSSNGYILSKVLYGNEKVDTNFLLNKFTHPDEENSNLLPNINVRKLLPGHYLEISSGEKLEVNKYWFPEKIKESHNMHKSNCTTIIKGLMHSAVARRSDLSLKAGSHLSGGLDSGIIAVLAREQYKNQKFFPGFSWSPGIDLPITEENDERKLVIEIAEKYDIEPVFTDIGKETYIDLLNNWRYSSGYYDEIVLRKNAQQMNINLIFSGWGGDEFVSINSRGINSDLIFRLQWRSFLKKYPGKKPLDLLKIVIAGVLMPAVGLNLSKVKGEWSVYKRYIIRNKVHGKSRNRLLRRYNSRRQVHLQLLNFGHLSERTEDFFLDGYPKGIEYRYPLLDKSIIEYILSLPSKLLYKDGYVRYLIRESSNGILPDSVAWSKSKREIVRENNLNKNFKEIFQEIIDEIPDIKSNPHLQFFNFKQLENDISKNPMDKSDIDFQDTIFFTVMIKQAHEFSKGYFE